MKISETLKTNEDIHIQVLIIGSGYGGSVLAARLAPLYPTGEVLVAERGKEFARGDFPEKLTEAALQIRSPLAPLGLFDFNSFRDLDVLDANGLGGTSLINAAVMLRANKDVFLSNRWPQNITFDKLKPFYEKVENILAVKPLWDEKDFIQNNIPAKDLEKKDYRERMPSARPRLLKTELFEKTAQSVLEADLKIKKVPLAINIDGVESGSQNMYGVVQNKCRQCGNCVTGCNINAKNTLAMNYLPLAKKHGARLVTQLEVLSIQKTIGHLKKYKVTALATVNKSTKSSVTIYADNVFLSAGVLGTLKILFQSQKEGLSLSSKLGSFISGNADTFSLSALANQKTSAAGFSSTSKDFNLETGPTITAAIDLRDGANGKLLQEGAVPSALTSPGPDANRSMVWLSMGTDQAEGQAVTKPNGSLHIQWPQSGFQKEILEARKIFSDFSKKLGSVHVENPREALGFFKNLGSVPISVHPLGGAIISDSEKTGVTNEFGQVWNPDENLHDGFFIVDGSMIPTSLGANPSLTIAALAERTADHFIQQKGSV